MSDEPTVVESPPPATEAEITQENLEVAVRELPDDVRSWLLGETLAEPEAMTRLAEEAATKMNLAMAYLMARRLAAYHRQTCYLEQLAEKVFDPERLKSMTAKQMETQYHQLTRSHNEMLEVARKFTLQNKDLFNRDSQVDELARTLRELPPEIVGALLGALKKKGAGTTVEDLQGVKKDRKKTIFDSLMGDDEDQT